MSRSTLPSPHTFDHEPQLWEHLKEAIASSSGFQQWQDEQVSEPGQSSEDLDKQVCSYLRETLETLAY
jgi:hypothetical protein